MSEGFKSLSAPNNVTNLQFLTFLAPLGFIPKSRAPTLEMFLCKILTPFHPISLFNTGVELAIFLIFS
jgi:hypothetical protein